MEFDRTKKISLHLNIAPLIDVIFLLLIFFMLSTHFITQKGIKVTLPTASTTNHQEEKNTVTITLTKDNAMYLNDIQTDLNNILPLLKTTLQKLQTKSVIIQADENINLKLAVEIMDIAKQADAQEIIIATKKEKNG
ncbi:MAG: biopolymer transporter ExbD [Candidatus Omnitrophota bacterium]|nr:biopolymer transporter ExbD [Candidatus Omnitrophota bacterium]